EVAVACLAGMHEKRWRAGGGEGGRDLAGDMAALSHARDDDAALGSGEHVDRRDEGAVEALGERRQARDLRRQDAARDLDIAMIPARGCCQIGQMRHRCVETRHAQAPRPSSVLPAMSPEYRGLTAS